jgi:hypothetical protein
MQFGNGNSDDTGITVIAELVLGSCYSSGNRDGVEIVLGQDFISVSPSQLARGSRAPLGVNGRSYGNPDNPHPFHRASCGGP